MAQITAGMVKDLREKTGAGMMDCKKALAETDGDMQKAIDYLREKGIEATLKLAESPNSKIVIVGNSKDGMPLILGDIK